MYPFKAGAHYRSDNYQNKKSHHQDNGNGNGNHQGHNHSQHNRYTKKKDYTTSYYVYGKSAAVEFVCDETKKQRINTITLHAASARADDERGYDWENKTIIQIPRNELLTVTAIMLGYLNHGEFRQNGLHASKSYTVEHQQEKIFVMVMERGKPIRAVGLSPEDSYQVVQLFLKQLHANSPWMTVSEIIDLIDATIVRMKTSRSNHDEQVPAEYVDEQDSEGDYEVEDDEGTTDTEDEDLAVAETNYNY